MYLGIDIGTSSVKAVLVDDNGVIAGQASDALTVSRPQPGFSEQDPGAWWQATVNAVRGLPSGPRAAVRAVPAERTCGCASAIEHAILTSRDAIPAATRVKLEPIIGKYV